VLRSWHMEPTVYLDGRARLVARLTDAEVAVVMGLVMGNDGLGPLLDRVAADVGDGDDRALIAALARAKAVEGGVLELPG
jgi:hypothetical protein